MEKTKKIPQRSEIPVEYRWATEDLYASDALWEQDLQVLARFETEVLSFRGRLGSSAQVLLEYLTLLERTDVLYNRLGSYANRKHDEDTRVPAYQDMMDRFSGVMVKLRAASSFEIPEVNALEGDLLESFYVQEPKLERFRRYLEDIRRQKGHVLPPSEERLLASAGDMARAPAEIYGAFSNADIQYPDAVDAQGNAHPLSSSTFTVLQSSFDRTLRQDAYQKLYSTLMSYQNSAAAALAAQVRQLQFFAQARHYPSSLDAALARTDVPTSVYFNLIEAVHQNLDKMHRYVRLRKKLLGVEELHFYDVYSSLVPGIQKDIPIEEAKATVYDALAPLGDEYRAILKEGFENRWIDVYENVGKRTGAYSAGADVHPYVLLNYSGNLKSQFTLAHEMGHALHSYYSHHAQNPIDAGYVIFVAEVASTCNEALLMEYLLERTTDRKERAFLINHFLEQFKGTLYRQTMFAEFELKIGQIAQAGEALTAQRMRDEYRKLNELYFGPDMVVDDEISMEWARIPHFYYNYYVFQYATGYSAAIALSQGILNEGKPAVERYLDFLRGGCSKSPVALLQGAGVDMSTPEPVNRALHRFGELLDEMEALMAEA